MKREDVYKIIDEERNYQDQRWGAQHDSHHSVEDFIIYMTHYLNRAVTEITCNNGSEEGLKELRKLIALGVACFEVHGVPNRK